MKKITICGIVLLFITAIMFFFFHTPGRFVRGLHIPSESRVIVYERVRTRIGTTGFFDFSHTVEHELNHRQVEMLNDFLRSSRYVRTLLRGPLISTPPVEMHSFSSYDIRINNEGSILIAMGGYVSRGGRSRWLRIRNPHWDDALQAILELCE